MSDTMDLGAALRKNRADFGPLAEMVGAMRDEITREVLNDVLAQRKSLLTEVAEMCAQAVARVQPPHVTVAAALPANNTITLPEMRPVINVELPDEDEQGEIDALNRQTITLEKISTQLSALIVLLNKPVTKVVVRDGDDQIIRVTESR